MRVAGFNLVPKGVFPKGILKREGGNLILAPRKAGNVPKSRVFLVFFAQVANLKG